MNSLFKNMQINQLSGRLRQIAGTPNVLSILRRRPPLFQIQGRMAERYPAPAGRIVSRH